MDSIPSFEFHEIFSRVSIYVDLQGKVTAQAMNEELWKAREKCKRKHLEARNAYDRVKFRNVVARYGNLIRNGFAQRTLKEALIEPEGFIANTLLFGRIEAKRRLDAQRRSRMRFYKGH
jgi:hypothetical protein